MVRITYNHSDFDPKHYPIRAWHWDRVERLNVILELDPNQEWFYQATIHGVCFWVECPRLGARMDAETLRAIAALPPGLRWFEPKADGYGFGFEFSEPQD